MTQPLVFVDTETDSLAPGRRAWEIAMIRRDDDGERELSFFVDPIHFDVRTSDPRALEIGGFWDRHPVGRRMTGKQPALGGSALDSHSAARSVMSWTFDATLVGVGVHFDAETLDDLLRREGLLPTWHYAVVDLKAMAAGWLAGRGFVGECTCGDYDIATLGHHDGCPSRGVDLALPWRSEQLSLACGVAPPELDRHTARGDARWAMRWYDALTGRRS